jgi:hypothetical protein
MRRTAQRLATLGMLTLLAAAASWAQDPFVGPPPPNPFQSTGETAATPSAEGGDLTAVFDTERPADCDLLLLASGDVLRGELLDQTLSLQTPYVLITLPIARVAGLDRGDPGDVPPRHFETLVTVNGDEFSGLGPEPKFHFRLETGQEIAVHRELVHEIILRRRPGERTALPRHQHFILRGGDHFSGLFHHEGPLTVRTSFANLSLDLAEVSAVVLSTPDAHGRITMLTGTDTAGDPEIDKVRVSLDALDGLGAPPIDINAERVAAIFPQEGAIPDPDLLTRVRRARSRSLIPDAIELDTDGTPVSGSITTETDTYYFQARAGASYDIQTQNIVNIDTFIRLLGVDGQTNLGENDDGGINGLASRLVWTCPSDGVYYLQVWRLGMGPGQMQPGVNYGYTEGTYEVFVRQQ